MRRRMIGGQTVSNGIYILHTNGKLYTSDKWNYSWRNDAVGVALISDNSSFVISGIELKNRSWSNTTGLIQGVTTITSSNEAKKILMDFKTHIVSRNIRMLVPLMNVLLLNSRTGKWDIWHQWENGWRS